VRNERLNQVAAIQTRINKGTLESTERREIGPDHLWVRLHLLKDALQRREQTINTAKEAIVGPVLAGVLP